jgi:hypothetical protein
MELVKPSNHSVLISPLLPEGIGEGDRLRWRGSALTRPVGYGGGVIASFLLLSFLFLTSCSKKSDAPVTQPHQPTRQVTEAQRPGQQILQSRNPDGTRQFPQEPGSIFQALSADSDLSPRERIRTLQEHFYKEGSLHTKETEFLFAFLRDETDDLNLRSNALYALKNDALNLLSLRMADHAPLIALLQEMQTDEKTDPVMRNYATQFLASLDMGNDTVRAGHWSAIGKVTSGEKGKVSKEDAHNGATALLHLLPVENPELLSRSERRRLEKSALRIASRDDLPDSARLTALQVCGQMKYSKAADLAYELSQSADASFPLRIAAVATLGQLRSDEKTVAYLKSLLDSPNTRLRAPAQAALKTIYEKQSAHNQS